MASITLLDCVLPLAAALSEDWVYRFLLEHDPLSDLESLTSLTHLQRAFAGVSLYDAADTIFCAPKAILELFNTNWTLLPVRKSGRYSALLVIKETAPEPTFMRWTGQKAVGALANSGAVLHAVQDMYTSQLCILAPDKKVTTMHCMVAQGTHAPDMGKCRHRAFFAVPIDALHKRQLGPIAAAIKYLMCVNERPNCSSCQAACYCATIVPQLCDDERLRYSFGSRSYNASCNALVMNSGAVISSTPSISFRSKIYNVDSPDLVVRLIKWAISTTLASILNNVAVESRPCPTKLVEIAYRTMTQVSDIFKSANNHPPILESSLPSQTTQLNNNTVPTTPSPLTLDAQIQQPFLPNSPSSLSVVPPFSPHTPLPLPVVSRLELPSTEEFRSVFDTDQHSQSGLRAADLLDLEQIDHLVLGLPHPPVATASSHSDIIQDMSIIAREFVTAQPQVAEINCTLGVDPNQDPAPAPVPPPAVSNSGPKASKSSATITNAPLSTLSPARAESSEADLESREARLLRRKIRNRESAARSNRRKQLYRAELKRNIAERKKKLQSLRATLEALLAENARLKRSVGATTPT